MRVESLSQDKHSKIKAINQKKIPYKDKQAQIKAVFKNHNNQIKSLFTPVQHARYMANRAQTKEKNKRTHETLKAYKQGRVAIKKLPRPQRASAKEAHDRQYVANLSTFLKPDVAKNEIAKINRRKHSHTSDISALKLPKQQTMAIGGLKRSYFQSVAELKKQKLSKSEKSKKQSALKKDFLAKFKGIIGEAKFNQWTAYKRGTHERRYKNALGFSPENYSKFKDVQNRFAIESLKIKRSNLTPAQKQTQLSAAKEKKVESLRASLPAEQFGKWYKGFSTVESKKQSKKKKRV